MPPAALNFSRVGAQTSKPVTEYPDFMRCVAMPKPMAPRPQKPMAGFEDIFGDVNVE